MRSPLFSYFLLISLLGCQGAGNLNSASSGGGSHALDGGGNDVLGNAVTKTNPDGGSTQETPQTISSSPVMGSVVGGTCVNPNPLCLPLEIGFYDPEECPGTSVLFEGRVGSNAPDTVFENVEVTLQHPGGTAVLKAFFIGQDSSRGLLFGQYHTFLDVKGGDLIKISVRRKDHPEETAVTKEVILYNPIETKSGYQGSCNSVLMDVLPGGNASTLDAVDFN